jgi:type III secretion protein J
MTRDREVLLVSTAMRALGIAVVAVLAGCSTPIQHGLDESSANEVVTALERTGIEACKGRDEANGEAFTVSVSKAQTLRALEILQSLGLPRGRRAGFGEMYKQASLVPSPTEERARFHEALAGEIERTLESVEGVVSARVHLVLAEPNPMAMDGKPQVAAQAAVLLKLRSGPAPISEADVQKLVAGSVAGLTPQSVAVVTTSASAAPSAAPDLVSVGPLRVAPGNRGLVLAVIFGSLAIIAVLAALLFIAARRLLAAERGERKS